MRLRMTNHFIMRMHERGISVDDVKRCLRTPDSVKGAGDGKLEASKRIDGRGTITVIYFHLAGKHAEFVLMTAYYDV